MRSWGFISRQCCGLILAHMGGSEHGETHWVREFHPNNPSAILSYSGDERQVQKCGDGPSAS